MKLALEVIRLETEKDLAHEGRVIMRSVRNYGKGKGSEIKFIHKKIKQRELWISELEILLLQKEHNENILFNQITTLGEKGVAITCNVLEELLRININKR